MMPRKSLEPYLKDEVQFYDHQVTGVRQAIRMRNFLLADDMGLGKSLQALTVATADIIRGWAEKILIVAPVTLKSNWSDEIDKFTRMEHMILGQALDPKNPERLKPLTPIQRSKQIDAFNSMSGPRFLIVNYEQIRKHLHELNAMKFDIIIFDEAHYLKNYKAKRTEACHKLRSRRVFALTGTPMLNQVNELWGILHMLDPGAFPKYWTFVNRYCVFGGFQDKQIIGVKNEKELIEKLNTLMIRRLKSEVLDLPEVQYIQKKIDLLPAQQKLYDQVVTDLQISIGEAATPSEIENALVKLLRLKEICGTTFKFTGKDESSKLDLAVEDAVELLKNGHKIVVFTQFRDVQEAFCKRLDEATPWADIWELNGDVKQYNRQPIVNEWGNHSGAAAIVCMLQVAGVGLNMTKARHAMFLDKLWVPGMNQQAVDRLHRIGASETQPVQVLEYLCNGTIESRVETVLKIKSKLFGTIVNDVDFKKKLLQALMEQQRNAVA